MFRTMIWSTIVLLTVLGTARPADPPAKDGPADDGARVKGLSEAAESYRRVSEAQKTKRTDEVTKHTAEFVARVQQVAAHLPLVEPEETAKPKAFHKLTLNAAKCKFDAFRFQVPPAGKTWNMSWEFVVPRDGKDVSLVAWYIVPREGTMQGFASFSRRDDFVEKGVELTASNRQFSQKLSGGRLKAGGEYVIWFAFKDTAPIDVHVRIGLTPAAK